MKKGIKLWTTNHDLYDEAICLIKTGKIDYIELLYFPGHTKQIGKLTNIEVLLHGPTSSQGFSFGDGQFNKNKKILDKMLDIAVQLGSNHIILHPELGSIKNFIRLLKSFNDERFVVENMPKYGINEKKELIAYSYHDVKRIINETGVGFCLDLAHASKTAVCLNMDYKDVIKEFLSLDPKISHISDGLLGNKIDEHLDLGKGDFDLIFFKSAISNSTIEYITFEVPKKNGLENDIKNISKMSFL